MNLGGWEWAILGLIALLLVAGYRLGGLGSELAGHQPETSETELPSSPSPASPVEPEAEPSGPSQQ